MSTEYITIAESRAAGVIDEPYSAKPAWRSSRTGSSDYIGMDTVPAYK
jgi:hypothetical protein